MERSFSDMQSVRVTTSPSSEADREGVHERDCRHGVTSAVVPTSPGRVPGVPDVYGLNIYILWHIAEFLSANDIGRLLRVCKRLNSAFRQEPVFKMLCRRHVPARLKLRWSGSYFATFRICTLAQNVVKQHVAGCAINAFLLNSVDSWSHFQNASSLVCLLWGGTFDADRRCSVCARRMDEHWKHPHSLFSLSLEYVGMHCAKSSHTRLLHLTSYFTLYNLWRLAEVCQHKLGLTDERFERHLLRLLGDTLRDMLTAQPLSSWVVSCTCDGELEESIELEELAGPLR